LWFLALELAGCSCAGIQARGEVKLHFHELTILAVDGDEWSALCSGRFVPEKNLQLTITMRLCMKPGGQLTFLRLSTCRSYRFIQLQELVEKNNTVSTECMAWLLVEVFTK
jgi:hypothetical protein